MQNTSKLLLASILWLKGLHRLIFSAATKFVYYTSNIYWYNLRIIWTFKVTEGCMLVTDGVCWWRRMSESVCWWLRVQSTVARPHQSQADTFQHSHAVTSRQLQSPGDWVSSDVWRCVLVTVTESIRWCLRVTKSVLPLLNATTGDWQCPQVLLLWLRLPQSYQGWPNRVCLWLTVTPSDTLSHQQTPSVPS